MAVVEKEEPLPTFEEIIDDLCVYVQPQTALIFEPAKWNRSIPALRDRALP